MIPVIKYEGLYYLKLGKGEFYINGEAVDPTDEEWCEWGEQPLSIKKYYPAIDLPSDSYPEKLEEVEFQIFDYDEHPPVKPSYIATAFPFWLKDIPELWHKFPCSVSPENMFYLLYDRIVEECENRPQYWVDGHRELFYFKVYERVPVRFHQTEQVLQMVGKKRKWVEKKKEYVDYLVLHVAMTIREAGATQVEEVRGADYFTLEENLEGYIKQFLSVLDDKQREVCTNCQGLGVIET
jgi:hypothetical protein